MKPLARMSVLYIMLEIIYDDDAFVHTVCQIQLTTFMMIFENFVQAEKGEIQGQLSQTSCTNHIIGFLHYIQHEWYHFCPL